MGLFLRRLFWFILVVMSGLTAAFLGASQYGINIDLNAWAKISGLHEMARVTEIIKEIPALLNYPIVKSYGFYSGLFSFLMFLLIFKISLRSRRNKETEVVHAQDSKVATETDTQPIVGTDSTPESFAQTYDGSSTATEIIAETNSDAIVGTDGEIYDGTATFSGTDTYDRIDVRAEFVADAEIDGNDDDADDVLEQAPFSEADDNLVGLTQLTDTELKSKTLNIAEEMRSFEADYQNSRDKITSELTESASDEDLREVIQKVKDTYEEKQITFSSEFKSNYGPEAAAVRHEISKRLGSLGAPEISNPALDHSVLVGANPVTDAADLIEELVKKLA